MPRLARALRCIRFELDLRRGDETVRMAIKCRVVESTCRKAGQAIALLSVIDSRSGRERRGRMRMRRPKTRGQGAVAAVTALALVLWFGPADAADYTITISGDAGASFGGTCLSVTAHQPASHRAAGTVPLTLRLAGDLVSCAIQKKTGSGHLRIVITNAHGEVVADSSQEQPFGVVLAAGR
jgi:hypothetical protein